ncbi:fibroblast growth factor-binding protein 1-like [Centroberyx affinis]|uniref:fibroblast growth factor-binding protein 1-like n=1 Tax=Centroberyx affinis TaxID=166261 RepID=UPI003A5C3E08
MALLTHVTVLLLLACMSQQLVLISCQGRRGRAAGRGRERDRGQKEGRQHPKSVGPLPVRGELVAKDKSQCTWVATGQELLTLSVTCRNGDRRFSCEYVAKPAACPQYASNPRLYWKQIGRALKKQRKLCRDGGAAVRAGVCRKAPGDAHFRMAAPPPSPNSRPATVKACKPDNKKLAEEYCSDSWSSFCTFFFVMVQNDDC